MFLTKKNVKSQQLSPHVRDIEDVEGVLVQDMVFLCASWVVNYAQGAWLY